jgi:N-methylhydantoinase A
MILPYSDSFVMDFHNAHRAAYGYNQPDAPVEIVNIRVQAVGSIPSPALVQVPAGGEQADFAKFDERPVVFCFPEGEAKNEGYEEMVTPFYRWDMLKRNNRILGPAVVVRSDTTVLLEPGDQGVIDRYGNLAITVSVI